MNISALPTALAFTMNLTLCLIVLSSKPRNMAHRLFACFVRDSTELKRVKWQLKRIAENDVERVFLREALRRNKGNISKTALDVGMDRRQLQNMIRKHRLVSKEFKENSSTR